jgi:SDR family mycofactocin-dependent oxidoreductase
MSRVEGKVAFITGAARGQGRSHALRLAGEGADIIGVDACAPVATVPYEMATLDDLNETAAQVEAAGGRAFFRQVDVRDLTSLESAVADGVAELGRLDIVVANAGICSFAPASELSSAAWQEMIDINLTGVWHTVRASLPHLDDAASIILINSTAGLFGMHNIVHYTAAKHGVVGIMRVMAVELAERMIRVNTIHPTSVDTDMIHNPGTYKLFRPDLEEPTGKDILGPAQAMNLLPVPMVESRDVSNAVLFLASDESRYITGVTLPVDAGALAKAGVGAQAA